MFADLGLWHGDIRGYPAVGMLLTLTAGGPIPLVSWTGLPAPKGLDIPAQGEALGQMP